MARNQLQVKLPKNARIVESTPHYLLVEMTKPGQVWLRQPDGTWVRTAGVVAERERVYFSLVRELDWRLSRCNGRHAFKEKITGSSTQAQKSKVLMHAMRTITGSQKTGGLGFRFQQFKSFGNRHVEALVAHLEATDKSDSTIENTLSVLRWFCNMNGKGGMVGPARSYLSPERQTVWKLGKGRDKSAEALKSAAIADMEELIQGIQALDSFVAICLEISWRFGLRLKEVTSLRLEESLGGVELTLVEEDGNEDAAKAPSGLALSRGTKGGRDRLVDIETEEQVRVLQKAQAFVGPRGWLVHPERTSNSPQQNRTYIYHQLQRPAMRAILGDATPHSFRHQFAHDLYTDLAGIAPVVKGGDPRAVDPETEEAARAHVSEQLGHSRLSITTAYGVIGPRSPLLKGATATARENMAQRPISDSPTPAGD